MYRYPGGRSRGRLLANAAGLLATSILLAACGGAPELSGETEMKLPNVATASLPAYGKDAVGQTRGFRPDQGRLMLVYFGYLSCPDVCPTTMSALAAAIRSLPADRQKQLEVAMVTGDPKRDSGEDLLAYLGHFFRKQPIWGFRTSDRSRLDRVERAFGAASEIDPHKPGESYTVTHTAYLYAVDRNGTVLVMWPFGALSEDIAKDLTILLDAQDRQPIN